MSKIKFKTTNNKVGCYIYTDLKNLEKEQIEEIKNLLNNYGVLFFKNQNHQKKQPTLFHTSLKKEPTKKYEKSRVFT